MANPEPKAAATKPAYTERQPAAPESAPAVAPLVFPKGPEGKAEEGLPKAPRAQPGLAVPRTLHQNERAAEGLKRFKILATNNSPARPRYVLAKDKNSACEHYIAGMGALPDGLVPQLVVQEMAD